MQPSSKPTPVMNSLNLINQSLMNNTRDLESIPMTWQLTIHSSRQQNMPAAEPQQLGCKPRAAPSSCTILTCPAKHAELAHVSKVFSIECRSFLDTEPDLCHLSLPLLCRM